MAARRIPRSLASAFRTHTRPLQQCTSTSFHIRTRAAPQSRSLFTLPSLKEAPDWSVNGIHNKHNSEYTLMTAEAYQSAWEQYQGYLLYELNKLTANDPETAALSPLELARKFGRNPGMAHYFNLASAVHNQHFFFQCLTSQRSSVSDYPSLKSSLEAEFGSMDNLRDTILDVAEAMFGVGYVWLVAIKKSGTWSAQPAWRVLPTYNAGTPYNLRLDAADGLSRAQDRDMNSGALPGADARGHVGLGAFGHGSPAALRDAARPLGGPVEVVPALCVSVWQHAYIPTFTASTKNVYLETWWDHVNWEYVNERMPNAMRSL